jgi:hypothetical protein
MLIGAARGVALVSAGQHPEHAASRWKKWWRSGVVIGAAYVTICDERVRRSRAASDRLFHVAAGDVDCDFGSVHGTRLIATLVVTAIAVAGTSAGLGVFGQGPADERVSLLLAYLCSSH